MMVCFQKTRDVGRLSYCKDTAPTDSIGFIYKIEGVFRLFVNFHLPFIYFILITYLPQSKYNE